MTDEQKPDTPEPESAEPKPTGPDETAPQPTGPPETAPIPLEQEPEPAVTEPSPPAEPPESKSALGAVTAWIAKAIQFVLTPIVWVLRPLVFRISHEPGNPKVSFTSFSTLIYLWPIMVVGWLASWASGWQWVKIDPAVLGWIWITVVFVVMICIGADLHRGKMIALAAVVLIIWLGGYMLTAKTGIPVLRDIYEYFEKQQVQFDAGTARVFSIITAVILIVVVIGAWFDGRYEITTREITHLRLLRTSDSLPRAAKRIKRDWRDLAEFLLGVGAGDLIVIDTNKNVVLRITNVPFLWFFRHDVDHILEVLATVEMEDIAAAEEEEFG